MQTKLQQGALLLIFLFGNISILTAQDTTTWTNQPEYSDLEFTVPFMVVRETEGHFESFNVVAKTVGDNWDNAQIEVTVPVKHINTGDEERDNHLQKKDFFNAKKHPKIKFKSTAFNKHKEDQYRLKGKLTMRGNTHTITLDVEHKGTITNKEGDTLAGFKINGAVDRHNYNIYWNEKMESGEPVVAATVEFSGNIVLKKLN